MSPNAKTLTVVFGGMAVMVVTTVCGAMIGYNLHVDESGLYRVIMGLYVGAIGAVVGVPIWVLLIYLGLRNKNAAPNEVIPDDSTT